MTEEPSKTKVELAIEEVEKYSSIDEAKAHIKDIAENLKISKALVYKAIKRSKKFVEGAPIPAAVEPTVKIPEAPIEEGLPIEEGEEITPTEEAPPTEAPAITPPAIPMEISQDDVETMIEMILLRIEGLTKYDKWHLTPEEKERWIPKATLMLNKYLPVIMVKYFAEVVFLVTTVTIFGGKYYEYRMYKTEQEEKKKAPPTPPTPPTKTPTELTKEEMERRKRETPSFVTKI